MACPSPDQLLERGHHEHLDACIECQLVLSEMRAAAHPKRIGKYRLDHVVGEGGMGVIYSAFDEELHRTVALKLVHPEVASSPNRRARMLREAQALAQLSHPNIVTVFEAGCHEDEVFIALEFVEGANLRVALRDRNGDGGVALVLASGRGLAAIHAAGLVHRDFKPENVLVGRDGRVRVGDLGLARIDDAAQAVDLKTASSEDETLTQNGSLVGTIPYMAHEQLAGGIADARSDQFAFCVVLYEALYGAYPFRTNIVRDEVLPAPGRARVPRWLRRLVLRGLAQRAEDRHPSMDALIDAIQARRRWRRRGINASALVATAAIAAGIVAWHGASNAHALAPACDAAARKLDGVWDVARRQRVAQAFTRTGHPHAAEQYATVAATLDKYTSQWVAARTDACLATHERGEQSQARLDERIDCLDVRLREVSFHVSMQDLADKARVERAGDLEHLLVPLDVCMNPSASRRDSPAGSERGVSEFDDGTTRTEFGAGWSGVTDRIFGGTSDVAMTVERGGADHTPGYLSVTGKIQGMQSMRWAGAMFSPGAAIGEPANLSKMRRLQFWARGDGRGYGVAMFSQSLGRMPALLPFAVTSQWKQYVLDLAGFTGLTTFDVTGLMFTSNQQPGAFSLDIDGVKFLE